MRETMPTSPQTEGQADYDHEMTEPVKIPGKHRFLGGTCVDCGKPLAKVCAGHYESKPPAGSEKGGDK